ncbi:MAG: HD domain-containing protein [Muribaculum sp.]|nr:HD domain-containing protein [Muribaculum sp.]
MNTELYKEILEFLKEIINGTEWDGHVYAVGGCCRDELMGNAINDVDLAVDLPNGGIHFAEWLHKNGITAGKPVIFPKYGTAKLHLRRFHHDEIEIVQTRSEKYTDRTNRNPEIAFGSLKEDCMRRDLTINSLYFDITNSLIVDLTGRGIHDIQNHIIRTPSDPDLTYDDDPVRILRCIRFACRFGWEIEKETYDALCRNIDRLNIVTPERKQAELEKMLTGPRPAMALELMRATGAMRYVVPELCSTFDLKQNRYHFGTVWQHTLKVVEGVENSPLMRMAALLHDIGKVNRRKVDKNGAVHFFGHERQSAGMVNRILGRLHYHHDFIRKVEFLVRHHMDLSKSGPLGEKLSDAKLRKLQYLCQNKVRFLRLMDLIDADNRAYAEAACKPHQTQAIIERMEKMEKEGSAMFHYSLPIDAKRIVKMKKLKGDKDGEEKLKKYINHLLELAFENPLRPKEKFRELLNSYNVK